MPSIQLRGEVIQTPNFLRPHFQVGRKLVRLVWQLM